MQAAITPTQQIAKGSSSEGGRAWRPRTPGPRRRVNPLVTREIGPAVRSARPLRPPAARLLRGLVPPHVLTRRALTAQDDDTGAPRGTDSCRGRSEPAGGLGGRSPPAGSWVCVEPSTLPALQPHPLSRGSQPGAIWPPEHWWRCLETFLVGAAGEDARLEARRAAQCPPVPRVTRQANANSVRLTNPAFNARPRSSGVN